MELGGQCQFLHRRDTAERHVRALVVVRPEPAGGLVLCLLNRFEQHAGEPSAANSSVVALDIGILLWLTGLDVCDVDAGLFRSGQ